MLSPCLGTTLVQTGNSSCIDAPVELRWMCSARQAANDAPMAFLFVINGMYVRDVVRVMHVGAFIALRTRCALVCCTSILRIRFQSISSNFLQLFCNCNYRSWCNGTCVVFAISSCSSVGVCMALEM